MVMGHVHHTASAWATLNDAPGVQDPFGWDAAPLFFFVFLFSNECAFAENMKYNKIPHSCNSATARQAVPVGILSHLVCVRLTWWVGEVV